MNKKVGWRQTYHRHAQITRSFRSNMLVLCVITSVLAMHRRKSAVFGRSFQYSYLSTSPSPRFHFPAAQGFTCEKVPKAEYVVTIDRQENLIKFPLVQASHTGSDRYWVYQGKFIENDYQIGSAKLVVTPTSQKQLMLSYRCSKNIQHEVPLATQQDVLKCVTLLNQK
jgi:hypothetical protein